MGEPSLGRNLSFHLLWSSTFASGVGDRMAMFAALSLLGYAGKGVDNSSIQSGIDFFFFLPYLLWSPIAGWISDRLPRKWVLFAADELRGVAVLGAFLFMPQMRGAAIEVNDRWMVWTMMGVIGVMAATFVPAKLSVVPNVVGEAMLTRANAAVVSMGIIGNLIGFIIGGPLAKESATSVIGIAAACYMISGTFWIFMKTPWAKAERRTGFVVHTPMRTVREIHDGLRYAVAHRPVTMLILTAAIVWTGTSIYMPALAVVNVTLYGGDIESFGLVAAPVGLGMLIGAVILGAMNTRLGTELLMTVGLFGCGLFIALQMIVPTFAIGVAIALLTGISAGALLVPLNTLLQRITPDYLRGRVFAAKEIITEFGKVVLAGLIWKLPSTDASMRPAAIVMGVGLMSAAAWGGWRYVTSGPGATRRINVLWRFLRWYTQAVHRLIVRGRHRLPRRGAVLVVSNHTSGVDPALIQAALPRMVHWMMAREYMTGTFGWLWRIIEPIGVRRGERDGRAALAAIHALRDGQVVGIFPEGRVNQTGGPMLPFGPGVGLIAQRGEAWIVPVHITGPRYTNNPLWAYVRPSRAVVTIGEPFRLDTSVENRAELTAMIRARMER
ncbi:MAG: MFS transporter [Planctomycetes bacterium]|nr:MFS transporter [Planctomycetota bacterium]